MVVAIVVVNASGGVCVVAVDVDSAAAFCAVVVFVAPLDGVHGGAARTDTGLICVFARTS